MGRSHETSNTNEKSNLRINKRNNDQPRNDRRVEAVTKGQAECRGRPDLVGIDKPADCLVYGKKVEE